ncbi:MAG TPA: MOSC domain-containing protein [Candidatus Brocadiaceae bacterium]
METLNKKWALQSVVVHMKEARLLSIQVGLPKTIAGSEKTDMIDEAWTSGIFKAAVLGRVWLSKFNLKSDAQANLKAHGGPHRAVNVYPSEHYPYWKQDLRLSDMPYGGCGKNFTTQGLLENEVCIGDVFNVGDAVRLGFTATPTLQKTVPSLANQGFTFPHSTNREDRLVFACFAGRLR